MKGFIIILGFISVFLFSYQLIKMVAGKRDYMSRLNNYTNKEEAREEGKKGVKKENEKSFGEVLSKGIAKAKFLNRYKKKLQIELTRAHLLLKADELITLNLIISIVICVIVLIIKGSSGWLLALAAGIAGWRIPMIIIKSKTKKRLKVLNEQLGDSLTMMSNSMKSGYSFFQAVEIVVEEMTGPISEEFGILQKEISLGQTTEKALENMAARVSSEDLELVITAVMIQRQVGGNLAEVLDNITATIRDRVRIKGELKTVTAQGRLSGWIISLLPLILYCMTYLINPKQTGLMLTKPLGIAMIVAAVVMELIGVMLIRKVVQIEM